MRDVLRRLRLERRLAAAFAAAFLVAALTLHVVSGIRAKRAAPMNAPTVIPAQERATYK